MLDIKQDIESGDVDLSTGDIVIGEATEQHQRDILIAEQGFYKESPGVGVGSFKYMKDIEPSNYMRAVRKQFVKDGMTVREIKYDGRELSTDAEYENNNG